MQRIQFPCLAILILTGCQPDWPALGDTEPASQRDTRSMERSDTDAEDWTEIPEQDVRADWLKGKVVHIVDGDTLDLLVDEEDGPKKIRIRLQGIDCPEGGQPWGNRATEYLADLVHGETVEVLSIGEDVHERLLGRIYVGEDDQRIDVNHALVAQGLAWHFKRYSDDEDLSEAEIDARRARRACGAIPTRYRLGIGGDSRVRWNGTNLSSRHPWMGNTG